MKKQEFFNELEYLLQDIPEEEKRDAIDYYMDYLEEAGPENEEAVLQEFESPERIAAIIRTDLIGVMGEGGEFTENGYEDRRFERRSLPVVRGKTENPYSKGSYAKRRQMETEQKKENKIIKYLLIGLLILIALPFGLAGLLGIFSGVLGLGSAFLALVIVLAVLTFVAFLGGITLLVYGITQVGVELWFGMLNIGLGMVFTGAGCLLFLCSFLFYVRFLPWAVRSLISLVKNLFGSKEKHKKTNHKNDMPE